MIQLDSKTGEKENILELINASIDNPALELECLFNNSQQNKNRYMPNISYNNFISILKRYKNHPDFESKTSTRLAITFPETSKLKDIRISIKGTGAINGYCNTDNLSGLENTIDYEIKSRVKNITIPNYDIKFNLKEERNFNNDESRIREITREWSNELKNYRYKKTFTFMKKTGDFKIDISIVKSSITIDRFLTVKEVIDGNHFKSITKPIDEKKGFVEWWKSIENDINHKVMVRGGSSYFKTIKESNVFSNVPTYEVEVEYIHNKTTNKPKFKNIDAKKEYIKNEFINFFRVIGGVLQCIQGSSFLLSNREKYQITRDFIKTVTGSIDESMLSTPNKSMSGRITQTIHKGKPHQGKQVQHGGSIDMDNELTYTQTSEGYTDEDPNSSENESENEGENDGETEPESEIGQEGGANVQRKLAEMRNNIEKTMNTRGIFFGPLIVDLEHNNASLIDTSAIPDTTTNTNIHINYVITDKTDGERCLLFINHDGKAYGVDRSNTIKSFGITLPGLSNSILDGEYINRTEDDKPLNNYYIFDAYVYKDRAILHLPFLFGNKDGRHNYILEAAKYFTTAGNIIQNNSKMPFQLFKKDYYPGNSAKTYSQLKFELGDIPLIAQNCNRLLNKMNVKYGGFLEVGHLFTYKTDGLVFLPNNLGIFQKFEDDYVKNPFLATRWNNNYKWKPADHLTIDFKIQFNKDIATGRPIYQYIDTNKYVVANMISAVYQSNGFNRDNNPLNLYLLNSGVKIQSIPKDFPFFAVDPFVGHFDKEGKMQNNMSETLLLVDKNDNIICENGDIIADGLTVECGYRKHLKNEQLRWQPQRIRPDKVANGYLTAFTTWRLINNPITKEQLSGWNIRKYTQDDQTNDDQTIDQKQPVITTDLLAGITYYANFAGNTLLTQPLKDFNNFVKKMLIEKALSGYVKPRVMELAAGKLGDLHKYISCGVNTLLGIEIGYDNLNNIVDGAATRFLEHTKLNPAYNKLADRTILIVGDTTKNIATGDCVYDNLNKYYLDVLYGRAKGNTPKLKKMESVALDGFDVVSCMYAIHYMMNNENDLDNFLRNVSENLLEQGYFIGTCLDGISILKDMGRKNEIEGIINDKTVFLIRKIDSMEDNYKEITVGNKVEVFFETFAGTFPENLVNMTYLRQKAKNHNLKLMEYRTFLEEPGNLLSQYDVVRGDNSKNALKIRKSDAMMTWSKYNAYFIFQKVRNSE